MDYSIVLYFKSNIFSEEVQPYKRFRAFPTQPVNMSFNWQFFLDLENMVFSPKKPILLTLFRCSDSSLNRRVIHKYSFSIHVMLKSHCKWKEFTYVMAHFHESPCLQMSTHSWKCAVTMLPKEREHQLLPLSACFIRKAISCEMILCIYLF